MRRRLKVLTVGCKANFADSASIAREAVSAGFEVVTEGDAADVIVVNSCTVTHRADRDSRALARRARRENRGAAVVMAGCYAAPRGDGERPLDDADYRIGPGEPDTLRRLLRDLAGETPAGQHSLSEYAAGLLLGRRRMFLKIQDGCDAMCAYCVVPLARGRSRSVSMAEAVGLAVKAEEDGAREIVLTGIHAGQYGADRDERRGLARLVRGILAATSACRIRLGSIEPMEIGTELPELMAADPRVCPHLHVPLQSGSDAVLVRMRRPYTAGQYVAAVSAAVRRAPGLRIGADVIAGFPGETADDFGMTMALLADAPVDYLHVFPYSPRAGTESARWPDDVGPAEKKERVARLRALDHARREAFLAAQVGAEHHVLAERSRGARMVGGYSGNYAEVSFRGEPGDLGEIREVRITAVAGGGLVGHKVADGSGP